MNIQKRKTISDFKTQQKKMKEVLENKVKRNLQKVEQKDKDYCKNGKKKNIK